MQWGEEEGKLFLHLYKGHFFVYEKSGENKWTIADGQNWVIGKEKEFERILGGKVETSRYTEAMSHNECGIAATAIALEATRQKLGPQISIGWKKTFSELKARMRREKPASLTGWTGTETIKHYRCGSCDKGFRNSKKKLEAHLRASKRCKREE